MTLVEKSDRDDVRADLPTVIEQPGDAASRVSMVSVQRGACVVLEIEHADTAPEHRARRSRPARVFMAIVGDMVVLALLLVAAASIAPFWPTATPTPSPAASVLGPTPTAFVMPPSSAAWSDTARRVVLVYPTAWKKAVPSDSTLRLTARDGTTFLLYDTNFNRSPADGIAAVQRAHMAETASDDPDLATRNYTDGPVSDMWIGEEPAKEMPYTAVAKLTPNQPARRGEVLIVTHAGSQYTIQMEYGSAGENTDVADIIASIRFVEPPLPA